MLERKIVTLLFLLLCSCKANLDNDSLATLYTKPGFDSGTRPHINNIRHPDQYYPNNQNIGQAPQGYIQESQGAVPVLPQPQYYPAPTQPQAPYVQPSQRQMPMSRSYSNPYSIPPSYYQSYDSDKYYILPNYYNGNESHQAPN